jgi:hypothetical protein
MNKAAPQFIGKRIQVVREKEQLTITISQNVERWQEALLYAWLMAWTFCGGVFIYSLFTSPNSGEQIFFLISTALWSFFFYRTLKVLMWRKSGKEILVFKKGEMTLQNAFGNRGKREKFELEKIKQLGIVKQDENSFFYFLDDSFWIMGGERLGFVYNRSKIRFGKQLNPRDAQTLLRSVDSAVKGYSA